MSSYEHNDYGNLITSLVHLHQPEHIIEFGILEGYSLSHIIEGAHPKAVIKAYDIFEAFPYNHAKFNELREKFGSYISYGDFYSKHLDFESESIDFLHIDIANDGDTYEFFRQNYLRVLSPGGIALLEGGSEERDNYYWMKKFNKRPIRPVLASWTDLDCFTFSPFPSMTLIRKAF